jgi:putative tryptophan/tyrosine transport system substrate-binding protein
VPVKDSAEIEATIAALAGEERGGLLVLPDAFNNSQRDAIVAIAARHRLPAVYAFRLFALAGGLMSYGIDLVDGYLSSAAYVDRILKGTASTDLPVQAPVTFKLVINLKTANTLGFTISPMLLGAADEVIE